MKNQHKITIILATYNGESFLEQQLQSFIDQTYTNWSLYISDDGSSDRTVGILNKFKINNPDKDITLIQGPHQGFAKNFLFSICSCPETEYYAFSDQDDIWEEHKLEKAIEWFLTIDSKIPAMYCSRTKLVDQNLNFLGFSPPFSKPPSFQNAIIQSIAGGNTMLLNQVVRNIIKKIGYNIDIVSHDWWCYILTTAANGIVFYSNIPYILYRQHSKSVNGANTGLKNMFLRVKRVLKGDLKHWNKQHIEILNKNKFIFTNKNKKIFDSFLRSRKNHLIFRIINFYKSGIYRQTLLGNIALILSVIFNKI